MSFKQRTFTGAALAALIGTALAAPASAIGVGGTGSIGGGGHIGGPVAGGGTIGAGSKVGPITTSTSTSGTVAAHVTAPTATATASAHGGAAIGTPLGSVANASTALVGATVQSKDGHTIGTVQSVELDASGKPSKVTVATGDTGSVSLPAGDLSYDSSNKVVVSSLTQAEINSSTKGK